MGVSLGYECCRYCKKMVGWKEGCGEWEVLKVRDLDACLQAWEF